MTGPGFAFEVRPQVLAAYTETLRARSTDLAAVGAAVAGVRVEPGWFGRLPQAGLLAGRYGAHRDEEVAEVATLVAWLAEAAMGLVESAGRYSRADQAVAGVAGAVEAAMEVGIEIPDAGGGDGLDDSGDGAASDGATW